MMSRRVILSEAKDLGDGRLRTPTQILRCAQNDFDGAFAEG